MQAVEVAKIDYEPSDVDILYAEGLTYSHGLACTEFLAEDVNLDPHNQPNTLLRLVFLVSLDCFIICMNYKKSCLLTLILSLAKSHDSHQFHGWWFWLD